MRPPLNYEPSLSVPIQPEPPPAPKPPRPPSWWQRLRDWVRQEWQILTGKRW